MNSTARRTSLSDHIHPVSAQLGTMSLFRRGKQIEARQRFMQAEAKTKPLPIDDKVDMSSEVTHDDRILWMAYKKAKALLCMEASDTTTKRP